MTLDMDAREEGSQNVGQLEVLRTNEIQPDKIETVCDTSNLTKIFDPSPGESITALRAQGEAEYDNLQLFHSASPR